MSNCNYLVAEDNAGGLFLFITDNNDITLHAYTGFEYEPGSLVNAIHDLQNDSEAYELWENDILELQGSDAWKYCNNNGMSIIKWKGVTRVDKMGSSSIIEFSLNNERILCDRVYIPKLSVYVVCSSVEYDGVEDRLYIYDERRIVAIIGDVDRKGFRTESDGNYCIYGIRERICYEII